MSAVRAQRKVVPAQSLPTLDANTLQQLQDERHAMREAFDDFTSTLQQPAKTRVRCRPRRYVVSPAGTTFDPHEETPPGPTRTAADRRFCQRSACRGKARGSTRPHSTFSNRDLRSLEAMNLGAPSEPLSVQEEKTFGAYALDSNGHRTRLFGRYSAGPDRTLLLTTHAGLVLTRKERNRAQHAKVGNAFCNESRFANLETPPFALCEENTTQKISITVVHPTREVTAFDVRPADPVSVLNDQIAEACGVLPDQQRLLFKGQQLTPCFSFNEY